MCLATFHLWDPRDPSAMWTNNKLHIHGVKTLFTPWCGFRTTQNKIEEEEEVCSKWCVKKANRKLCFFLNKTNELGVCFKLVANNTFIRLKDSFQR